MSQLIANSGHFKRSGTGEVTGAVSFMDTATAPNKASPQRFAVWPMVLIGMGGVATLAWNGFLVWQVAHALIGWVAGEI